MFGFCTAGAAVLPDPIPVVPVVPPVVVPVPLPLIEVPPVVDPPAEPPAAPPACASANVLDSANAVARAMVVSFMAISSGLLRRSNASSTSYVPFPGANDASRCGDRSACGRDIARTARGQISDLAVQPHLQKYCCCAEGSTHLLGYRSRAYQKGRFAIVTNVGAGCGGRECADDEQRRSRTAKSCGPDAPVLASSPR